MDIGRGFALEMAVEFGELMARNRKGPPHQAKHFQPEDHAHAAHQEKAAQGHAVKGDGKSQPTPKTGHPVEQTPKGPRKER
jgi:hypothetical protein